jgi:hypothetical protein
MRKISQKFRFVKTTRMQVTEVNSMTEWRYLALTSWREKFVGVGERSPKKLNGFASITWVAIAEARAGTGPPDPPGREFINPSRVPDT